MSRHVRRAAARRRADQKNKMTVHLTRSRATRTEPHAAHGPQRCSIPVQGVSLARWIRKSTPDIGLLTTDGTAYASLGQVADRDQSECFVRTCPLLG
jgi:hypothetical protein